MEYQEKPTGMQLNLVKTSLGNVNPLPLRVQSYLTSRVRGTKVTKIFTVIFGRKRQGCSYLYPTVYEEKRQRL